MTSSRPSLHPALQSALQAYGRGRLDEARDRLAPLLKDPPRHAAARHLAGIIALQQGQTATALPWLESAAQLEPAVFDHQNNLGLALELAGQPEAALAAFDRALQLQPGQPSALANRGNALFGLNRLPEAIAAYEQALMHQPDDPGTLNNLADALDRKGESDRAEQTYRRALACAPADPVTRQNLADLLLRLRRPREALDLLPEPVGAEAGSAEHHYRRACALADCGDLPAALTACQRALAIDPGHEGAQLNEAARLVATAILRLKKKRKTKNICLDNSPNQCPHVSEEIEPFGGRA